MAVLGYIDDHGLPPAEQEVTHASAGCHGDAQITVVGHEDEHQEIAHDHLDDVQQGLHEVARAYHPLPERTTAGG